MPQHSYLRLKGVKAQVSCFRCKNIPDQISNTCKCDPCSGTGQFSKRCGCCKGSGVYYPYKQCWNCAGNGKLIIKDEITCQHCDEGKIDEDCDECAGWDVDYGCLKCDAKGTILVDCYHCHGKCQQKKWIDVDCEKCNGTGNFHWNCKEEKCKHCDASGSVCVECRECKGSGNICITCNLCGGKGVFLFE